MWAILNGGKIRHMWGSGGDKKAQTLFALCGESGKPPLDYLQVHLDKCSRCNSIKKRKEANEKVI